ncbi:MAG: M48 family metalloprotease [Granulosicoccaceae bacterium]
MSWTHGVTAGVLLTLVGCAANPVTGKRDLVMMSEQQEISLGRQSHPQILKQYPRYKDERLQKYVNNLGQALAKKSHRANLKFTFTVVDSPQINAFALPGGYIYVTRGIMAYMNSEAELAGVLGHEIGHVTARHGVRQQSTQTLTGLLGAAVAIGTKGQYNDLIGTASQALVSGYGRDHELEADRLGAEYLARTGRDPEQMIEVVGILKDQEVFDRDVAKAEGREPRAYHGLFASHPQNDTRLKEVVRAARKYSTTATVDAGRDRYLKLIDGMVFGDSLEQGVVRNNRFYHGPLDFKVSAPKTWAIKNSPSKLVFVRDSESAYMELTSMSTDGARSPAEFIAKLLKKPRVGGGRNLSRNGMKGYSLVSEVSKLPWGQPGNALFTVWFRGKTAWLFVSAAKDASQFKRLRREFDSISHSMSKLTSRDRANAAPRRIELQKVRRGDTYAKLARSSSLESYPVEQLRLLNGVYPKGEPKAGQLIKVVK